VSPATSCSEGPIFTRFYGKGVHNKPFGKIVETAVFVSMQYIGHEYVSTSCVVKISPS
jgi:hypothetical protein